MVLHYNTPFLWDSLGLLSLFNKSSAPHVTTFFFFFSKVTSLLAHRGLLIKELNSSDLQSHMLHNYKMK